MAQNSTLPIKARVSVVIEYDLEELRADGDLPEGIDLEKYLKETFLSEVFRAWLENDIAIDFVSE
jgi:hypothetical protein